MKYVYAFFCLLLFSGCNYTISLVHTEGKASDVIDETATASPPITADIKIPAL